MCVIPTRRAFFLARASTDERSLGSIGHQLQIAPPAWNPSGPMVEVKKESKCQICDSYNMKGMWQCECGVMNVSKNVKCWKCGLPRDETAEP